MKTPPKDISFHYTNIEMVKDLIELIPFNKYDSVLDAGSGKNKVWYNNIPDYCLKEECEIEDGIDFLTIDKQYDWIIGNPPFHISEKFFHKASEISKYGFAFLINTSCFNSLTPLRLSRINDNGFYLQKIHIVNDKRWFGRYYFLIFTKNINYFLSWNTKSY